MARRIVGSAMGKFLGHTRQQARIHQRGIMWRMDADKAAHD
jgi:hypothetical protein